MPTLASRAQERLEEALRALLSCFLSCFLEAPVGKHSPKSQSCLPSAPLPSPVAPLLPSRPGAPWPSPPRAPPPTRCEQSLRAPEGRARSSFAARRSSPKGTSHRAISRPRPPAASHAPEISLSIPSERLGHLPSSLPPFSLPSSLALMCPSPSPPPFHLPPAGTDLTGLCTWVPSPPPPRT
jgi:hypothetical protein